MKWTPEKIEELRRRYPHEDNGPLARDLGCSRKALAFRASHLGIRKTQAANEARHARLARKPPAHLDGCERREIRTGTLIIRGNVITHLSNCSVAREEREAPEQAVRGGTPDSLSPPGREGAPCPVPSPSGGGVGRGSPVSPSAAKWRNPLARQAHVLPPLSKGD
jgi:hypothetical protein